MKTPNCSFYYCLVRCSKLLMPVKRELVSRVGIVHVGEAEGPSRVAEAGPGSTNPNGTRVGDPKFRELESARRVVAAG
jgi:hypothetical protein